MQLYFDFPFTFSVHYQRTDETDLTIDEIKMTDEGIYACAVEGDTIHYTHVIILKGKN